MQNLNDTAHKILDIAEYYTQTYGFNAFSYKDIQNEVGIKTSSIHYYFSTKQDLAYVMTERYIERFSILLNEITQRNQTGHGQLKALANIYINALKQERFCMCGMLASDALSLPDSIHNQLNHFFNLVEEWISHAIKHGQKQEDFKSSIHVKNAASHFLAALEGGMLIARTQKKPKYLEAIIEEALKQLKS